jgi:ATP-dependent protease ClpP protease subunit
MPKANNTGYCQLRLQTDRSTIILEGSMQAERIKPMIADLSAAVGYFSYDTIQFHVNSPGGDLEALHELERCISWQRQQGKRIVTTAQNMASSAAALLVAQGDPGWRMLRSDTHFLLHELSFGPRTRQVLDKQSLSRLQKRQEQFTDHYSELLYQRAIGRTDHAPQPAQRPYESEGLPGSFTSVNMGTTSAARAPQSPAFPSVESYRQLFQQESILSAQEAKAWRLVDEVVDAKSSLAQWFIGLP